MRFLALFVVVMCSFHLECSTKDLPSVYVRVSWKMVWRRFCHFVPFFAEKLSEKLYDAKANVVKASRIRFINATELCKGKGNNAEAILDFFVSKSENDLGTGDVDRNITILAYIKMRDYWKNKKMALLDPVFIGQVKSVEILGKDKPDISEDFSESTRIGIGITVALIVIFLIAAIVLCLRLKLKSSKRPLQDATTAMSVPLHVIHSESSTSPQKTEGPPVYEFRGRARDERDGRSSNSSYTVRTSHGNTAVDDEYQRREKRYNGHSVRNHSNTTFEEEHGVGQESFNGYPAGSNGSVVLDYEDFGSPML